MGFSAFTLISKQTFGIRPNFRRAETKTIRKTALLPLVSFDWPLESGEDLIPAN